MRALVLAVLFAGCARPAEPPRGVAQVCVLRPDDVAAGTTMEVRDNGRLVGATRGTTYFCYLASPGEHQITSGDDTGPTLLVARSGARYWLHQEMSLLAEQGDVHAHLVFVDEEEALEMMDTCTARVRVAVPRHEERDDAMPIAPARRN